MKLGYGVTGVEIPDDCTAAVGFRAIHEGGTFDIVGNRIDRYMPTREAVDPLLGWYETKALDWLSTLAGKVRGNDTTVYVLDEGPFHARASAQASYGYLYVTLWMDGGGDD